MVQGTHTKEMEYFVRPFFYRLRLQFAQSLVGMNRYLDKYIVHSLSALSHPRGSASKDSVDEVDTKSRKLLVMAVKVIVKWE